MPETDLDRIEAAYDLRDPSGVRRFIEEHPQSLSLLQEACEVIGKFFHEPRLALDIFEDPEDELDAPRLVLKIGTSLPPREAVRQLGQLQDLWFAPITMRHSGQRVILGVEPV